MYIYLHTHMYIYIHMYTNIYTYVYTYIRICIYTECYYMHLLYILQSAEPQPICKTLQHTATTHCNNTLQQHTAPHCNEPSILPLAQPPRQVEKQDKRCNTLQHAATHCNTLQHTHSNTLQHAATHCNTLQHTHSNTLQHTATSPGCCRVLQCVAVCCSVLHCVAACCSVLQRLTRLPQQAEKQTTHTTTHCNLL